MGLVLPRLGLEWKVLPYLGFKAAVVQDDYALSSGEAAADKSRFYAEYYPYSIWNGDEATDAMRGILKRYVGEFPHGKQVPRGIYNDGATFHQVFGMDPTNSHKTILAMFHKIFGMDPTESYKTIVAAKAGPKGDFTVEECEVDDFATVAWGGALSWRASQGFTPIMAQPFTDSYKTILAMFHKIFGMDPTESYKFVAEAGPKGDFTVEQCEASDFSKAVWGTGDASQGFLFTPIMAQSFKVWEARQNGGVLQPLTAAEAKRTGAAAKKTTMVLASDYATATPNTRQQEQAILRTALVYAQSYPAPAERWALLFFSVVLCSFGWSTAAGAVEGK